MGPGNLENWCMGVGVSVLCVGVCARARVCVCLCARVCVYCVCMCACETIVLSPHPLHVVCAYSGLDPLRGPHRSHPPPPGQPLEDGQCSRQQDTQGGYWDRNREGLTIVHRNAYLEDGTLNHLHIV